MANVFDLISNVDKLVAENGDSLAKIPAFLDRWSKFMTRMGDQLERIENRMATMDRTLTAIIDGYPPAVTPEIFEKSIGWTDIDDRQKEVIPNG
jgi:hypothetical protein